MMKRNLVRACRLGVLLLASSSGLAAKEQETLPAAPPPAAAVPAQPAFSVERLDQLVAPIALYPDPLLIQVLIASTYPLEVVEADRWRQQRKDLKDAALDKALEDKDWDPSVEGLTHFPDLLKRMSDNLDWTKDLGDAFLAQRDAVLDAVQRMRSQAEKAGTLKTTKEQVVTREVVKEKETIVIQPASPQVVYVPTYPPAAYGTAYAPAPYYPAVWGYTPGQMATASLLSFGVGVGVGALIGGGCDWNDHHVTVNNNYYGGGGGGGKGGNTNSNNTVNINKNNEFNRTNVKTGNREGWKHDPTHRRNVGYRDPTTADRVQGRGEATRQRQELGSAGGYDRGGAGSRAPGTAAKPSTLPASPADRQARKSPERRGQGSPSAQPERRGQSRPPAASGGRQGAFAGYGNAGATREVSQRGAGSRGGQSWAGRSGSAAGSGSQRAGAGGAGRAGGGRSGGGRGGRR